MERKSMVPPGGTVEELRRQQEGLGERLSRRKHGRDAAERPAGGLLLYFHGGGYVSGDGDYAAEVASVLEEKLGRRVCTVPYGLAPDAPYPAAVDDAETAYRALLTAGISPRTIVLCGDSSGGGLLYGLTLRLKARGLPLPAGLLAFSPWVELSRREPGEPDFPPTGQQLAEWAALYGGGADLRLPEISPLYGDLTGLPPSRLFAGGGELLAVDATRLRDALLAAGCQVRLTLAPGQGHVYVLSGNRAAREAFAQARAFLEEVLDGTAPTKSGAKSPEIG